MTRITDDVTMGNTNLHGKVGEKEKIKMTDSKIMEPTLTRWHW